MTVRITFCAAVALAISTPTSAAGPPVAEPTAQDEAQIEAIVSATIASLKANQARKAANDFFRTNPFMQSKLSEIELFAGQIEGAITLYGPISECQLVEKENYGQFAQSRLYVCQHEKFLTRWIFNVIKSAKGWQAGNLRFDDKYANRLD